MSSSTSSVVVWWKNNLLFNSFQLILFQKSKFDDFVISKTVPILLKGHEADEISDRCDSLQETEGSHEA
jgi:hypothetical protein